MKFVCLGYLDESKWDGMSDAERQETMEQCFEYDAELRRGNHFLGGEALESARQAVTLQMRNGSVEVTDGPFTETKEVLGGILLLEARDLNHAISLISKHPGVGVGPFEIRAADACIQQQLTERNEPQASSPSQVEEGEAEIRRLIDDWVTALEARDLDGIMANHHPDAVLYDAIPPYKTVGAENIRQAWEHCFPYIPEFKSMHHGLTIQVEGNMAFVYGLHKFQPAVEGHPCGQSWLRYTICYRKIAGKWKVQHEHVSQPFNPMNNQAWPITDPEVLDMPDYGQACSE